jgi:hypothetical protein
MPLPILLALVVSGIAGIALLLHITGNSRRFVIGSEAVALHEWARHFPDDPAHTAHLGGGAALVQAAGGPGLVRAFGADSIAHRIASMTATPTGLRIGFHDFAAPDVVLTLAPHTANDWLRLWKEPALG